MHSGVNQRSFQPGVFACVHSFSLFFRATQDQSVINFGLFGMYSGVIWRPMVPPDPPCRLACPIRRFLLYLLQRTLEYSQCVVTGPTPSWPLLDSMFWCACCLPSPCTPTHKGFHKGGRAAFGRAPPFLESFMGGCAGAAQAASTPKHRIRQRKALGLGQCRSKIK